MTVTPRRLLRTENDEHSGDRIDVTWWTRYVLIHSVTLVLFATAPSKACRSAAWARWFSSGKPIVMRAQLAYGGCARPISMHCESIAAASFGCGIPASKKMKFAVGSAC